MSNYAHIPWAIGITIAGVILALVGVPASFIGATGALLFCFTREETQREYQIIETLDPPLRSGLPKWAAFKFWQWNEHSKVESLLAIGAAYVFALFVYVVFGV